MQARAQGMIASGAQRALHLSLFVLSKWPILFFFYSYLPAVRSIQLPHCARVRSDSFRYIAQHLYEKNNLKDQENSKQPTRTVYKKKSPTVILKSNTNYYVKIAL